MTWKKALTDEHEKKLVVDHEDGFGPAELARRYGISKSTVYRILADFKVPRQQGDVSKHRAPLRAQAKGRKLKPCGTNAAYIRHKRNGEDACLACCDAHSLAQKEWSDRQKEK